MSYELLLFVHVLSAIIWVGVVFSAQAVAWGLQRAKDVAGLLDFAKKAQILGTVAGPAVVLLLVAGIALVEKLGYSYTDPWIVIGLSGFVGSILVGGVTANRISKRVEAYAEERGADDPAVAAGVRRLWIVARIDLVILLMVVWAMTWRPGA